MDKGPHSQNFFGRFRFLGKDAHSQNFFRKIFKKFLGKYVGKQ